MQGRMIALLIKTQRALKCDSSCRAELSTLHELSQKCGEFIKGDRTRGGGGGELQCGARSEYSRSGRQPATHPAAPLHLEFQKKIRPKC